MVELFNNGGSFFDIVRDSIMNDIILNNDKYEVEH